MAFGDWCECFFSVRFLKGLVFVLNLAFSLAGAGLLALSVWLLCFNPVSVFLVESSLADYSLSSILSVSGVIMFIIGVIGSYGAYRESQCHLAMASVFFIIILGVGIAGGVWASNHQAEINTLVQEKVQDIVYRDYGQDEVMTKTLESIQQSLLILGIELTDGVWAYKNRSETSTLDQQRLRDAVRLEYGKYVLMAKPFDGIQQSLNCCGSDSIGSWANSSYNLGSDNETVVDYKVPSSCCGDPYSALCQTVRMTARFNFISSTPGTVVYIDGCVPKLHALVNQYFINAFHAGSGIGMLAFFTYIFTILYCCAIRLRI